MMSESKGRERAPYWQRCPICHGKGIVPGGFYLSPMLVSFATDTAPERCRRCNGQGTIAIPSEPA